MNSAKGGEGGLKNRTAMRGIWHIIVLLGYLPGSGIIGPRILCTENSGASSIALASVSCCGCCDDRCTNEPQNVRAKDGLSTIDDSDFCCGCTDVLLSDEAGVNRGSSVASHHASVVAVFAARDAAPVPLPAVVIESTFPAAREGGWPARPGCVILRV